MLVLIVEPHKMKKFIFRAGPKSKTKRKAFIFKTGPKTKVRRKNIFTGKYDLLYGKSSRITIIGETVLREPIRIPLWEKGGRVMKSGRLKLKK